MLPSTPEAASSDSTTLAKEKALPAAKMSPTAAATSLVISTKTHMTKLIRHKHENTSNILRNPDLRRHLKISRNESELDPST